MLTNLIFNALEAMPEDGTITFRTHTDGKDVVLQVSDTGVGMSEETRKHCLDPFFTTKHGTGTGLGLSIVFGTVQRHGGSLDIHSKLGKGTTFIIRFPAQADAQPSLKTDMVSSKPDRPLHVLVVEDEPLVQMMITEFLANGGHSAETANNGREGLEKFRSGTYDVVITDRAMPDMNGDRLALAIKQENPDFPVIMLTGYGNIMAASGEMPLGVDALMSKPISVIEFWEILTKVTARRR